MSFACQVSLSCDIVLQLGLLALDPALSPPALSFLPAFLQTFLQLAMPPWGVSVFSGSIRVICTFIRKRDAKEPSLTLTF